MNNGRSWINGTTWKAPSDKEYTVQTHDSPLRIAGFPQQVPAFPGRHTESRLVDGAFSARPDVPREREASPLGHASDPGRRQLPKTSEWVDTHCVINLANVLLEQCRHTFIVLDHGQELLFGCLGDEPKLIRSLTDLPSTCLGTVGRIVYSGF